MKLTSHLGFLHDLQATLEGRFVDRVIIPVPGSSAHKMTVVMAACERNGIQSLIVPDHAELLNAQPRCSFQLVTSIHVRKMNYKSASLTAEYQALPKVHPRETFVTSSGHFSRIGSIDVEKCNFPLHNRFSIRYTFRQTRILSAEVSATCVSHVSSLI